MKFHLFLEPTTPPVGATFLKQNRNPNVFYNFSFPKFGFSFGLINFLTLRNENLFSFPSLNRNFALSLQNIKTDQEV